MVADVIEPIFNMFKVKFDIMDKWHLINNKNVRRGNVYINLENVFKLLIVPNVNNFVQAAANFDEVGNYLQKFSLSLISNIINLGQHYRLWFVKNGYDAKVFLYWNYPLPSKFKNSEFIPIYRNTHIDRFTRDKMDRASILGCLIEAFGALTSFVRYVDDVYLINPYEVESSLVPLILDREVYSKDGVNTLNLLITSSLYEYSYVNYGFKVINIFAGGTNRRQPILIDDKNVIEVMKIKQGNKTVLTVPSNFVEFIVALLGDTDRNLSKLTGLGLYSIFKLIATALDRRLITDNTKDINMLLSIIRDDMKDIFERNYLCTNLEYQYDRLEPLDIHKIKSCLVDNFDEANLNSFNEKYFKHAPIEIIRPRSEKIYRRGKSLFS